MVNTFDVVVDFVFVVVVVVVVFVVVAVVVICFPSKSFVMLFLLLLLLFLFLSISGLEGVLKVCRGRQKFGMKGKYVVFHFLSPSTIKMGSDVLAHFAGSAACPSNIRKYIAIANIYPWIYTRVHVYYSRVRTCYMLPSSRVCGLLFHTPLLPLHIPYQ